MSGSREGGIQAAKKNKQLYGKDFYARIGSDGGKKSTTGGFYYLKATGQLDKIREAGSKGGKNSKPYSRMK